MANTYSAGKSLLVEPGLGSYVNSWYLPVNSNFGVIDATISGTTTIDASSITPGVPFVVLVFQDFEQNPTPQTNPLAGQNLRVRVTGSLSLDISVIIPAGTPGLWIIDNQTTGNYDVNVKTTDTSSVAISPLQGYMSLVFCDGVNVSFADLGTSKTENINSPYSVQTGSLILFGSSSIPSGYLLCNGAAVSRTTYAALFAVIGTTWGAGDGINTFNVPSIPNVQTNGRYIIKT